MPGHHAATRSRPAPALHWRSVVVDGRIVDRQFLARCHVPHGNEHNLPLDTNVRLARVVEKHHHGLELGIADRSEEQIVSDLQLGIPDRTTMYGHSSSVE